MEMRQSLESHRHKARQISVSDIKIYGKCKDEDHRRNAYRTGADDEG